MDNHSTTLRHWLDRHRAGDPAATEELIRYSQDRFRVLVQSRLRDFARVRRFEDTDDILSGVQARFVSALRAHHFDSLEAFLRVGATLVRNHLIDVTRHYFGPLGAGRREVGPPGDNSTTGPDVTDRAAGPGDLARQADIDATIDGLPEEHRQLFHALYYLGLTQKDAADLLGVSLSTLKRRWLAARELFLARYGHDELA